jgi:D-alanyl-lipoteichoic acid acyltransferase DltB (MBOAT superfamily)
MLFSSPTFLCGFLPLSLIGFYLVASINKTAAKVFLIAISLVFYGWASTRFLPLLIGSVVVNYFIGRQIQIDTRSGAERRAAMLRTAGVAGNLALLIYFKYTNFLLDNFNELARTNFHIASIVLPLGISFFTFQRIAYLVDSARGEFQDASFLDFAASSLLFPQLISGPIVFFKELAPQIASSQLGSRAGRNLTVGLVIFAIGLFKKIVIADNVSYVSDPVFDAAAHGATLGAAAAWIGVLSYTVQLYFDFSGYSDMAIGAARMFGLLLPLNFHSPLRATSIIEYWRRWHMTLNRFMVRYFFQPISVQLTRVSMTVGLSEERAFLFSVVFPVFLTFVVLGIWHGAGWTYVLFGVLHASYVSVNEVWRDTRRRWRRAAGRRGKPPTPSIYERLVAHGLTLLCVFIANAMFRADTVSVALSFYRSMFGLVSNADFAGFYRLEALLFVVAGWIIIFLFPNTQQIVSAYRPSVNWRQWRDVAIPASARFIHWCPNAVGLACVGVLVASDVTATIIEMSREPAQFIYFQF